jgi:hypothetical protein
MSLPEFMAKWFKGKLKKNNLVHLPRASRKQRVDVSTRRDKSGLKVVIKLANSKSGFREV